MLFSRVGHSSKEAWNSLKRGGIMTFVATSTIAISLFVLGVFLLIFLNLHYILSTLNSKLDVVVYLKPNTPENKIDNAHMQITTFPGVKKIEFVSKEAAWRSFKDVHENLQLDQFVDANPLPDSFKIEVTNLSYINIVAKRLAELPEVEDVRYSGDIAEKVAQFIKLVSSAGFLIVILLGASTLMIVVNTIRLTVINRENEIDIMRLVGATRDFIKRPFILEGIYLGLIGACIALVALKIGYDVAIVQLQRNVPFLPIDMNVRNVNLVYFVVLAAGVMLGWIGGYVSVSKSLKAD